MIAIKHKFLASVIINGSLIPNSWDLTVHLSANVSETNHDIAVATERLSVWIEAILDNSMLVGPDDMELIKDFESMPFSAGVHPLIDEPYDHILAVCIYTKISSILDKKLFVDSLTLESYQGGNISHTHNAEEGDVDILRDIARLGQEEYAEYWYRKDPVFFRIDDKGVKLIEQTWKELELGFDEDNGGETRNVGENVVPLKKFKPRIIPGDKDDSA